MMASGSTQDDSGGADYTEAVLTLQKTVQKFQHDAEDGRADFVIAAINDASINDAFPHITSLTSANEDTVSQLTSLAERLRVLEYQLQHRQQWQPPPEPIDPPLPSVLDISDISAAIDLLTHIIASTHPSRKLTPQPSFSTYSWTWDPEWKEFYTFLPTSHTYLYLSRWKLDPVRNVWEHVHMAFAEITPDSAAEMLGAWEDWTWDPAWGEWCLEMSDSEQDSGRCCIYPSRWHVQESGTWMYVGRIGEHR